MTVLLRALASTVYGLTVYRPSSFIYYPSSFFMKILIYGMHNIAPVFNSEDSSDISACKHFAGGKRHRELLAEMLPSDAFWHTITVPLQSMFEAMEQSPEVWTVFASGDPLFYGIAITLKKRFPDAEIIVKPAFNSLQLLAHKLQIPYGEYRMVTLTGRPWQSFDAALMDNKAKISLLTDRKKTPLTIVQRMLAAGYDNYIMHLGEKMGGLDERVRTLTLQEACTVDFQHPNCIFLEQTHSRPLAKGIPEGDLETLPGRPKMITKMPVRLTTLALMNLQNHHILWDVGACSGSITIDARLNYPHLEVIPFEIRPECEGIITRNAATFGVPGVMPIIGDFKTVDKEGFPKPDAIFSGGYGGNMQAVFAEIDQYLVEGGIIAFNAVSEKSINAFESCLEEFSYTMTNKTHIAVDAHNPITIMTAEKNKKTLAH